jgi:uncharacterized protein YjiK
MRTANKTRFHALILLLISAAAIAPCPAPPQTAATASSPLPYQQVAQFDDINFREASGVVFHPQRGTLFIVGDRGHITELTTDGDKVRRERIRKEPDLEGISIDPVTGVLYAVDEGADDILEIDPQDLKVRRRISIDRAFAGETLLARRGNGIEGIAFVPDAASSGAGSLYLVNQSNELDGEDPSLVLEVILDEGSEKPRARIVKTFSLGVTDLSDIAYDATSQHLLVISDERNLLLVVSLAGQIIHVYPLPGVRQEGIALDAKGYLYIAQDAKDGILKLRPVQSPS